MFEAGLDAFLDRNSPARRRRRRKAREEKRAARANAGIPTQRSADRAIERRVEHEAEHCVDRSLPQRKWSAEQLDEQLNEQVGEQEKEARTSRSSRRRAIPAAVRDAVFARDRGRCSFIGSDGHLCGSKHDLEVDRCQPVARGGRNTLDNLRLLCAMHNRLEAERVFGVAWMQRFGRS